MLLHAARMNNICESDTVKLVLIRVNMFVVVVKLGAHPLTPRTSVLVYLYSHDKGDCARNCGTPAHTTRDD